MFEVEGIGAVDGRAKGDVAGCGGAVGVEDPRLERHRGDVVGHAVIGPDGHPSAIGEGGQDRGAFPDGGLAFGVGSLDFGIGDDRVAVLIQHGIDRFAETGFDVRPDIADDDIAARQRHDGEAVEIEAVGAVDCLRADLEIAGDPCLGGRVVDPAFEGHRRGVVQIAIVGPDKEDVSVRQDGGEGRGFAGRGVAALDFGIGDGDEAG